MAPITPHVAEELWNKCGFEGLVAEYQYPETFVRSAGAEYGETMIRDVIADITQIIKVTEMKPKRAIVYTTPGWKVKVMKTALELASENKLDIPGLTKACMSDPEIREHGKAASELAKKLAVDMSRTSNDGRRALLDLNEAKHLSSAAEFMSLELGVKVEVMSADEKDLYDPLGRSKAAVPGRPAIFLE
jgi:leucyl-tRNA synthetase